MFNKFAKQCAIVIVAVTLVFLAYSVLGREVEFAFAVIFIVITYVAGVALASE